MKVSEYMNKYQKTDFYEQISKNKIKSIFLILFIVLIIIGLVYVIAQIYNPALTFVFLSFGIIFSLIYVWIGYYYSSQIALFSVKAKEAKGTEFKHINNLVEGLALAAGLPKPKLYVMNSEEINAFASGRNPENAVICISRGAIKYLNNRELEGVIAHEMSHIANYDIRFVTLTIVLVGIVSIISEMILHTFWLADNRDNRNGIFIILGIVLAIITPIIAHLIQLAISRKREFMADANAVKLTRDNSGLISALKKIDSFYTQTNYTIANKTNSTMMIANPFSTKSISNLFSTHPPINERIRILENM